MLMWAGVEAESVHRLPESIDGLKVYHIEKYSNLEALQDGRKWRKIAQRNGKTMDVHVTPTAVDPLSAPTNVVLLRFNMAL